MSHAFAKIFTKGKLRLALKMTQAEDIQTKRQTNTHIALLYAYLSHPLTKEKQNAPALKTQPSSKLGAVVYIKCCGSLDVHSSRIKPLPTFFADREEFYNTRAPQTLDACPRARAQLYGLQLRVWCLISINYAVIKHTFKGDISRRRQAT